MDILLEAIRRCNALPVNSSASEMLPPAGSQAGEARAAVPASQKRRNKAKGKGENETRADTWDMGDDARDELLDATLGTLEVLAWELGDNSIFRCVCIFSLCSVSFAPPSLLTLPLHVRH